MEREADLPRERYRIVSFGWAKRGGWRHYDVARTVGAACESVCRHSWRSDAERCLAHRNAGGMECVQEVRAIVGHEVQVLLVTLARLSATAQRQIEDPAGLRATAEQIHDVAGTIIAKVAP